MFTKPIVEATISCPRYQLLRGRRWEPLEIRRSTGILSLADSSSASARTERQWLLNVLYVRDEKGIVDDISLIGTSARCSWSLLVLFVYNKKDFTLCIHRDFCIQLRGRF